MLGGESNWTMRFPPGQLPPGLALDADGGLMLHLQHDDPGLDRAANWLPTPKGPFFFVGRFYGPRGDALTGRWVLPPLRRTK